MSKHKHKAIIAGLVEGGGTGARLVAATAALSGAVANLGGYAVAQMVAGSVGLGGPALSLGIAAVGGPVVEGHLLRLTSGTARAASPSGSSDEGAREPTQEQDGEEGSTRAWTRASW
jgi:hypothetical protein